MHAISLVKVVLLALATSSGAISVTKPAQDDIWSSTGSNLVSWMEVSTDPTTFSLALVQLGVLKQVLANNVDGTKGSFTVAASNLPTGVGFQVNIVNSSNTGQIFAQSQQFNITQGGSISSASSTPPVAGTGFTTIFATAPTNSAAASAAAPSAGAASAATAGTGTAGAAITSAASGTNIPNVSESGTALNPSATTTNAASLSIPTHSGLLGLLALFGIALV